MFLPRKIFCTPTLKFSFTKANFLHPNIDNVLQTKTYFTHVKNDHLKILKLQKKTLYCRGRQAEGTRGPNFEFETSSRAAVLVLITLLKLLSFSFSQSEF